MACLEWDNVRFSFKGIKIFYFVFNVCVCMCVYMCVHMCVYMCMYIQVFVKQYMYMYLCVSVCKSSQFPLSTDSEVQRGLLGPTDT